MKQSKDFKKYETWKPIIVLFLILISFIFIHHFFAETQISLQNIQPTFEEEPETFDDNNEQVNYIKTKKKKKFKLIEQLLV